MKSFGKKAWILPQPVLIIGTYDENVEIEYTGLRAGEKLYEEVLSTTENTLPSFHKKIRIAKVCEYDYDEVSQYLFL